jgi:thiamine biosynthesis lipoprotein
MTSSSSFTLARRRFLRIAAASGACAMAPSVTRAAATETATWRGLAFGNLASMELRHSDTARARRTIAMATAEIARLESIMSLYRPDSSLSRLNRTGYLESAPSDLVQVLSRARDFGMLSGGAFDVTVQPLWRLYADHFSAPRCDPAGPPHSLVQRTVEKIDYRGIEIELAAIRLSRPGMEVTLNGIAQGYITDRIIELLKNEGFEHVLADLGEIRAMGRGSNGVWRAVVKNPTPGMGSLLAIDLQDQALATSGSYGFQFDSSGRFHHLFDPRSGACPRRYASISVIAPDATSADALATACNLLPIEAIPGLLQSTGASRAHIVMLDGTTKVVEA